MTARVLVIAFWAGLSVVLSATAAPVEPIRSGPPDPGNFRSAHLFLGVDDHGAVVDGDATVTVHATDGRVRRVDPGFRQDAIRCLRHCDAFVASGAKGSNLVPDRSIVWGSVEGVRREQLPDRGAPLATALVLVANAPDDAVILSSDLVSSSTLVIRRPNEPQREVATPSPFGSIVVSHLGNRAVVNVDESLRGDGAVTRLWLERDSGGWTVVQPPEAGVTEPIACMSGDGSVIVVATEAGLIARPWPGRTGGQKIPGFRCGSRGDRILTLTGASGGGSQYSPTVVDGFAADGTLDFTVTLPGRSNGYDRDAQRFLVETEHGFVVTGRQGEVLERLPADVDDAAITDEGQLVTVDRKGKVTWHR